MSDDEKKVADSAYAEYSRTKEKQEVLDAYWKFIDIEEKLGTKLEVLANTMKDSSALFVPGHTVFSFMEKNLRKRSEEIARKRVELQKQIDENAEDKADKEQELERLKLEQKDINAQFKKLASNPVYLMQRELSEQGKESLHRPLYNMHLDEFNVYAQSYLENLEKVAQDGLYSDQSDPDLEAIMQQYVRNLGSNIDEIYENIRMAFNAQLAHVAKDYFPKDQPLEQIKDLATYVSELSVAISNGDYKSIFDIRDSLEEKYPDLRRAIASTLDGTDVVVEQLLASVPPKIGGMSLFDFVEKVSTIKSTLKKSPIYDIIKTLSEIDGGFEPLVDTLDSQILAFLRSDSLDDYFIKDPKVINKLERLNGILDLAAGLIEAHLKDGFNDSVNMFRKTLGKELFGHIDRDVAMTLASELDLMKRRLDTLLTIARQNSFKSLSKQMDIETNMRRIWFADFSDPKSIINGNISRQFGIDVEKILQDSGYDPNNSPEENLAAQVKFETGLYEAVSKKAQEEE